MISKKQAETLFWIFFTIRQQNFLKKHQVSFKKYCFDFQDLKIKQIKYSPRVPLLIICYPWTLVHCTEMAAEPPFRRGPLNIFSLLLIPLRMSSWFHQGWNVSFQPFVKNIGLEPAFQNDGVWASFTSVFVQGFGLNRKDLNLYQCHGINYNARKRKIEGQSLRTTVCL
jgi:hypothetical protein